MENKFKKSYFNYYKLNRFFAMRFPNVFGKYVKKHLCLTWENNV